MSEQPLIFDCEGSELVGMLHHPAGHPHSTGVVILVGGPQYRVGSHRQFVLLARELAAAGFCAFRFDYRGMGDSGGTARSFEEVDADIRAAINAMLSAQPRLDGVAIFGLCDAASSALMYCPSDPRVRHLILANPWVRTEATAARTTVRHYYTRRFLQRSFWQKMFSGRFRVSAAAREFVSSLRMARGAGENNQSRPAAHFTERMRDGLARFHGKVLLLLSERDLTAREFEEFCNTSGAWRECIAASSLERCAVADADHTFSSARAMATVSSMIVGWLRGDTAGSSVTEPM